MGKRIALIRVYFMMLIAVVLCVIMVTHWIGQHKWHLDEHRPKKIESQTRNSTEDPAPHKLVIFHLDLKGAPPKMSYLLETLPLIKRAGANAILLEYEDMFPWKGSLQNISAVNAYTIEEIELLMGVLTEMNFEIIPLVQAFGHLEFILKLEEFRDLRELDSFPQEICPSKPNSFKLIKEMIRQVMDVHRHSKFIHIGCDEVYHLAGCSMCSRKNPKTVFASHVKKVAGHIKNKYPGITVIIWDDMLRKWSPIDMEESQLGHFVEPMVWVYIDDIPRLVPHYIWYVYKKTFPKVWGASAFKGAFGERKVLPDLARHVENNLAWLHLLRPSHRNQETVMNSKDMRGLAITGWSRYDHFAVLTELLPVALPSLIFALKVSSQNPQQHKTDGEITRTAIVDAFEILNCPKPYPFETLEGMRQQIFGWFAKCQYPGSHLYKIVSEYTLLEMRWQDVIREKNANGWVTEYNERYKYSSPYRLLELFGGEGFAAQILLKDVKAMRYKVVNSFQGIYDNSTIEEWAQQHLLPIELYLENLAKSFKVLMDVKSWAARPLLNASANLHH